jgi:tetratricopeptide (TPR) repeat protein
MGSLLGLALSAALVAAVDASAVAPTGSIGVEAALPSVSPTGMRSVVDGLGVGTTADPDATPPGPAQPVSDVLERAWRAPAGSLERRVLRTRRTALEVGTWSFDAAARVVESGSAGGAPLERARTAVMLAPDLPAARIALARALWLHGDAPIAAIRAVGGALAAAVRHPEASLWFAGSALYMLATALVIGGLLAIAVAALACGRHAAHDAGHLLPGRVPESAGFALLAGLLLVPLVLGEGLSGLALGALAVAVLYGSARQRVVLTLAAVALVAGAFPVMRLAGAALSGLPADPVASAAYSSANGLASSADVAPLVAAAADGDELASRALAIRARQTGALGEADAHYQGLLALAPDDVSVLNNAANVRLELGHMEAALDLYRHANAVAPQPSPVVLYNLSQAHGRAFQMDDLGEALARAQAADGELVAGFTALQGATADGFVVDLPLPTGILWRRVLESGRGGGVAAGFRAPLLPGRLGRDLETLAAAFALVLLCCTIFGVRLAPSRGCDRCGANICPRCSPENAEGDVCEGCVRLFLHPEKTDRALRLERMTALKRRESRIEKIAALASVVVPGAAGALARRPFASLQGAFFFTLATAAATWSMGVVPDPLVAGAAAPIAFLGLSVLSGLCYATVSGRSLAARRRSRA